MRYYNAQISLSWAYKVEKTRPFLPLPLNVQKLKGFQLQSVRTWPTRGSAPRPRCRLHPRPPLWARALAVCPSQTQFLDPPQDWTRGVSDLPSRILTRTELSGHCRLFVLVSFLILSCLWLRLLDEVDHTQLLSPRIVSYSSFVLFLLYFASFAFRFVFCLCIFQYRFVCQYQSSRKSTAEMT